MKAPCLPLPYILVFLLMLPFASASQAADPQCTIKKPYPGQDFPTVRFETSLGTIDVELDRQRAPLTVDNFLRYVKAGHYNNTIFHRIVPDFVVQGGGYTPDLQEIPLCPPVVNESGNGLRNEEGTLAMARFDAPHSARAQFYFNLKDNNNLDPSPKRWGYAVFGYVTEGMDVLQKMASIKTGYSDKLDAENVPQIPVIIKKVFVLDNP